MATGWWVSRRDRWLPVIETNWRTILAAISAFLLIAATGLRFVLEPYYISDDSALFQHAGWYITQGATPYVDFWDLKPPLIYAVTTLLAVLSGGDMLALHVFSILVANVVVIAGVILVGALTYRLTKDGFASLVAGGAMFVVPSVYTFPSAGIRPKYFAFFLGALALWLAIDDRPGSSGAAAAASAGFWQLGAPIAALVVAIGFQRGGPRRAGRTAAGGLIVAGAVVLPFVIAGLGIPLFLETVLAPVYGVERYTLPGRMLEFVLELGYGIFLVPLGLHGWIRGIRWDRSRYWWVGVGGGIYGLQIFLELQGAIELILLVMFLAIGVGVLAASVRTPSRKTVVAVVVVALAIMSLFWMSSPVTPIRDEVAETHQSYEVSDYESLPELPEGAPSMQTIYWEQRQPDICHYRYGKKQRWFVQKVGGSLDATTCGEWPFDEPPGSWFAGHLGL